MQAIGAAKARPATWLYQSERATDLHEPEH
jgi:hypothetical protein